MNTKNIAKEVTERISQLTDDKAVELTNISANRASARKQLDEADSDMKSAIEVTDITAYEKAKIRYQNASNAIEMYSARYQQLQEKEFVSEAESNRVIDSLLSYEDELKEEYSKAMEKPLKAMKKLHDEYYARIAEAETAIIRWTHEIHANYRNEGTVYADGSNRSKVPVPVRRAPFNGCTMAQMTKSYLRKVKSLCDYLDE